MRRSLLYLTRVALAAFLLGSVLFQILLPAIARDLGGDMWETAGLVAPYSVLGILSVVAVQVGALAVWWLLERTARNALFEPVSLCGADVLPVSLALATLIPVGTMTHLQLVVGVGGPGIFLMAIAVMVTGAALTALMLVLRGILTSAIADHTELEQVI